MDGGVGGVRAKGGARVRIAERGRARDTVARARSQGAQCMPNAFSFGLNAAVWIGVA